MKFYLYKWIYIFLTIIRLLNVIILNYSNFKKLNMITKDYKSRIKISDVIDKIDRSRVDFIAFKTYYFYYIF